MNVNDLVHQVSEGNHSAYRELLEKYISKLSKSVGWMLGSSVTDLEDTLSEIIIEIYEKPEDFASVKSFESYLYRAVRNKILNARKREKLMKDWNRTFYESMDQVHHHPEDVLYDKEHQQLVRKACDNLTPARKEVFSMKVYDKLTLEEIAVKLGISKGTAQKRMDDARKSVMDYLEKNGKWFVLMILIRFL